MLGVLPLFTWGTRADGFKMASRWWQRLDCSKGGLCVPPTPAVQLTLAVKQHLSISSLYLLSSSPLSNTAQSHYWGFLLWMGLCTCLCYLFPFFPSLSVFLSFAPFSSHSFTLLLSTDAHNRLQVMHGSSVCTLSVWWIGRPVVRLQCRATLLKPQA